MMGILPSLVTGPINPYDTALSYMGTEIGAVSGLMRSLFTPYIIDSYYTTISIKICVSGAVCTDPYQEAIAPAIGILFIIPLKILTPLLSDGLLVLYTQIYMILFFMYASIPIFLIPGVILRSIFPMRSVGGMLIAIAIGFYFIMPVLYSVAFYFTNTGVLQTLNSASVALQTYGNGSGAQTNGISPTSPLVLAVGSVQSGMGAFWMSVLFYPSLILAVTYESIRILADFIGGAAKTAGLMRRL